MEGSLQSFIQSGVLVSHAGTACAGIQDELDLKFTSSLESKTISTCQLILSRLDNERFDAAIAGAFSIAFWVKPDADALLGADFQYLYSHSAYGLGNTNSAFATNSINVFLPEQSHPAYGLVRSVVKDDNDNSTTSYLDSDGTYNDNNNRTGSSADHVTDGNWHFITLTSRIDGQKGYMLYVDGSLAAQLPLPG